MNKIPLQRNTRFDVLKSDEGNSFMQRRTKSYPVMPTVRDKNYQTGNKLRRINSARFESKNNIKYKPRLDVNSMTMFPKLGDIIVSTQKQSGPSFSEIIQNLEETMIEKNPIKEGWVRLTKEKGEIVFKYNHKKDKEISNEENYHDRAQRVITSLVTRWQDGRDKDNEIYGDMSPYWNTPSLLEPQSDDEEDYMDDEEYEEDN
tara:strand:- start:265 stop:873 length:609 start_codon:yes stop_codon:yes gene_type:complete